MKKNKMNNNKINNSVSTSPQTTTKVSEHGSQNQLENIMQDNVAMQNLSNSKLNSELESESSKKNVYLPKIKTDYEPSVSQLTTAYESSYTTKATDPVTDQIAVNNISTSEFDNTEDPLTQQNLDSKISKKNQQV